MHRAVDRSAVKGRSPIARVCGELGDAAISDGKAVTYAEGERGLCRVADVLPAVLAQYGVGAEYGAAVTTVVFAPLETLDRVLTLSF